MKKLLNTLYVTLQGAYLHQKGQTACVRYERETKLRIPLHTIQSIVCFGRIGCSPNLLGTCGARNINVSFLTQYGRFQVRVEGPVYGNVLLRRQQYRWADDEEQSARISKSIVAAKIANCRVTILRANRERIDDDSPLSKIAVSLGNHLRLLKDAQQLDVIRGIEGRAAHEYFSIFDELILHQKDAFSFHERSRRPPLDPINALLSFIYTLLVHDVVSALETVGLDPAVGFLHRDRPGRPGLALDLMEEFRSFFADRLALSLINLKQIKASGFTKTESGAVQMDDESRRTLLQAYQKRKQEEMNHPYLNEKAPIGLFPFIQAQLLARHIRGDMDDYPPFLWR